MPRRIYCKDPGQKSKDERASWEQERTWFSCSVSCHGFSAPLWSALSPFSVPKSVSLPPRSVCFSRKVSSQVICLVMVRTAPSPLSSMPTATFYLFWNPRRRRWPSSSLFAKSQVTGNLQELATPNPIGQLQVARHRAQVPACSTGTSGWRRPCEKGLDHSRSPRGFLEPSFCCLHTFQCLFCSSFSMFSRHYLGQLEKVVSEAKDKHHFIPEALQVPFLYPLLCAAQNQTWNFIW